MRVFTGPDWSVGDAMLDPFNVVDYECVKMMIFSLILLFGLNSVSEFSVLPTWPMYLLCGWRLALHE